MLPQLQFVEKIAIRRRRHPCRDAEAVSHGPACLAIEIHQSLFDKVVDVPSVQVVQDSCAVKFFFFLRPCAQAHGRELCPQRHSSHN